MDNSSNKQEEVTEVRETNVQNGSTNVQRQAVSHTETVPGSVLARRIIYYIGGALLALLAVRFVLLLLGASQGNAFVDFIYALSGVFVWPFDGIFGQPTYGSSVFDSSTLVAIIVYGLLTIGIGKLFTLNRPADAV